MCWFCSIQIFGAPPQYLHPPLVILNELSLNIEKIPYSIVVLVLEYEI